ncbi:MAG: hypothetical protein L0332_27835 [Chloroflexi bacterium]|nr:hypothetical protein [Chloroflexota bacterium]MCI0577719.1 hypothetical protein [Chloroflexota bacterium]MCI0649802.1 hypothetical protein [Chloroflexota bacterium]MCI0730511.1 hypothetical protein [Chloroflexota bacterium]
MAATFAYHGHGYYAGIRPLQSQAEITTLVKTVRDRQPQGVLELRADCLSRYYARPVQPRRTATP